MYLKIRGLDKLLTFNIRHRLYKTHKQHKGNNSHPNLCKSDRSKIESNYYVRP